MLNEQGSRAIVVAGGRGTRFGGSIPKQFMQLGGMPIMFHSVITFAKNALIDGIVLVVPAGYQDFCREWVKRLGINKIDSIVSGGDTRQKSVYIGLCAMPSSSVVLIHDGARPFIKDDAISDLISRAARYGAATLAVLSTNTVKIASDGFVDKTLDRDNIFIVQTPQAFRRDIIIKAHENAININFEAYDDCHLAENIGVMPAIVMGCPCNIKITHDIDIIIASHILETDEER